MVVIRLHRGVDLPNGRRQYHMGASRWKKSRQLLSRYSDHVGRQRGSAVRSAKQYAAAAIALAGAAGLTYRHAGEVIKQIKGAFKGNSNQRSSNNSSGGRAQSQGNGFQAWNRARRRF